MMKARRDTSMQASLPVKRRRMLCVRFGRSQARSARSGLRRHVERGPPVVGHVADADAVADAHERRAEQARLGLGALEQPLGRIAADAQAERAEGGALAVDEGGGTELLGEATQLAFGGRPLPEVHEVWLDATLREEAERLASVLAVVEAEDLNGERGGRRHTRPARRRSASHDSHGTAGLPSVFARPLWGPW